MGQSPGPSANAQSTKSPTTNVQSPSAPAHVHSELATGATHAPVTNAPTTTVASSDPVLLAAHARNEQEETDGPPKVALAFCGVSVVAVVGLFVSAGVVYSRSQVTSKSADKKGSPVVMETGLRLKSGVFSKMHGTRKLSRVHPNSVGPATQDAVACHERPDALPASAWEAPPTEFTPEFINSLNFVPDVSVTGRKHRLKMQNGTPGSTGSCPSSASTTPPPTGPPQSRATSLSTTPRFPQPPAEFRWPAEPHWPVLQQQLPAEIWAVPQPPAESHRANRPLQ